MIDLECVGPATQTKSTWDPVIVVRHGILSSNVPFQPLAAWLQKEFPKATLDNNKYEWKDSILLNGARLADHIGSDPDDRDLILIGHSMGGLVCRVAACFLSGNPFLSWAALANGYTQADVLSISNLHFKKRRVNGLVTLATPNSGAMLSGQVSSLANLLKGGVNMISEGIKDLTSDRLFRLLQSYTVDTKVLTVSGSAMNRFSHVSGQFSNWLRRGGIRLDMPNDQVVEDRSVDLAQSILPNELLHLGNITGKHLRAYENCTNITHTNIYDDLVVQKYVADFLCRC